MQTQNAILSHKGKPGAAQAVGLGSALTVEEGCARPVSEALSIANSSFSEL
jgi:hypothetical protein